jgi:hypothetical protein
LNTMLRGSGVRVLAEDIYLQILPNHGVWDALLPNMLARSERPS